MKKKKFNSITVKIAFYAKADKLVEFPVIKVINSSISTYRLVSLSISLNSALNSEGFNTTFKF
jgi:hypothetical protein